MRNVIRHLPPRMLSPDERGLFAEWFAAVGDVASAYVSRRQSDDPAFQNRIIIAAKPGGKPTHVIYASAGRNIWVVCSAGSRTRIRRFPTLCAALNSIRPVLVDAKPVNVLEELKPAAPPVRGYQATART